MKESLLRQAAKLKQKNHNHKRWQKAVSILACLVVFCTVYALILPAVTMEKTAYCGKEEHTHTEDCYGDELICGQEESDGAHQHSDDCYREEQVLVCTTPESDGHQHSDDCYTKEEVLTCTNTDSDHEHNEFEGCYTTNRVLTCEMQEEEGAHHHAAECYETKKVPACGQEENDGHHHTEECYKKELVCQKEEHTHTLECYSNPAADVETEEQWSRAFANITLTGDWAKDLTAIAETQTGYTESDSNYTVNADNTTNGYTRYGQWAGMPYADWSATFTSFCLCYANVPESAVPRNTGCEGWNGSAVSPNGYTPKEGDIILLDGKQDGTTEHAGIVTSGSADSVTAIVGDSDKAVRRNTYSTSNAIITGYVPMPQNPALADDKPEEPEATPTEAPEPTKVPEATPTPEITKKPLRVPNKVNKTERADGDTEDGDNTVIDSSTTEDTKNQRIEVRLSATDPVGKTGQTLMAKVVSTYSQANRPDSNATICLSVGQLPEGIKIEGFTNGKATVTYVASNGKDSNLELTLTQEEGGYYISYEQPAGSTVEFDVQLSSTNGTMPASTEVQLTVDRERTEVPEGTAGIDLLDDSQSLTWTAKNEWDPVKKKVNGKALDQTKVNGRNLSGTYEYTIEANSSNRENYGEIWTDYITVTDTFTLPENISFPEGTTVSNGKIVTATEETILNFTDLQGGTVENLILNGKTVTYTLKIPNQYMNNGVPTMDQKHLNIKMQLDAHKLTVPEDYKNRDETAIRQDLILNHVLIQPHPYKEYTVRSSEDDAYIMPTKDPEKIVVSKSADSTSSTNGVKAGDTITYTLSVENTGTRAIAVKDIDDNFYAVTDTLPKYLTLTEEQKTALKDKRVTIEQNDNGVYIFSWIPSDTNIEPGDRKEISFEVTVKNVDDPAMKDLHENSDIINQAQYKSIYTEQVKVKYHKGYTTVTKQSDADGKTLNNGEEVTYTITVTNSTDIPVANETISDTLPKGLEFVSAQFNINGQEQDINQSQSDIKINNTHTVNFNVNGQNLGWLINRMEAHESLTFTYKCKVNTDQTDGETTLKNSVATGTGGNGNADISVSDPISVDKTVDKDTNKVYPDGQCFNYTITLTNDQSNPKSVKGQYLTDELPLGMILSDETAPLKKKDYNGNETTVNWHDFHDNKDNIRYSGDFTTVVDGRPATVSFNNGIILDWLIEELKPGDSVTINYQAKLALTEEQKNNGGSYPFTNTARYLKRSKSVTVYGGSEKGKLYLQKRINGVLPYADSKEGEEKYQEKYSKLTFELTGKNVRGEAIQFDNNEYQKVVRFSDFTVQEWNAWRLGYTFDNLPVGDYTIVETNADIEGKDRTTTYSVEIVSENGAELEEQKITSSENASPRVFDLASSGKVSLVTIDNFYSEPKSIDIQKSVWGIYDQKEYLNQGSQIASKNVFSIDGTKVIGYTITVINTGEEPVNIYEIQDQIPAGLTYKRLASDRSWTWINPYASDSNQTETTETCDGSFFKTPSGFSFESKVAIRPEISGQNLTMKFYQDKPYQLGKNKFFSFFVICETNGSIVADVSLTNTAKVIVDKDTNYKDYDEIRTENTVADAYQNNGVSWDEGIQNDKRVIASEVTVTPINKIIPGITKEAVSYIAQGESNSRTITTNSNISPQSAVKWFVTLYNDGTEDMTDYKVKDVITEPFHLITRKEAEALHKGVIKQAFTYTIYDAFGQQQYQEDITENVWNKIGDGKVYEFEFEFHDSKYTIPKGGYAKLELYTENNDHTKYQIYTNTATLIPFQEFNANGVKPGHGELVKDGSGQYIGVKASAAVNALGQYGTVSWKTITEDGKPSNTASGSDDKNYITVDKGTDVIYRNHITNVSQHQMHQMVMIDLLPGLNDTGVVNQEDIRGSEFTVSFADGLNVYKLDKDNRQTPVGYSVKYSSKVSFTDGEFKGTLLSQWHDQWTEGDKSFAVVFSDKIDSGDTLVCEYKGKLGNDASPGMIAWNSFGYRYEVINSQEGIIAEPPKVGVKIPASSPIIRKEVINSDGKVEQADTNKRFNFQLLDSESQEIATFEVTQGGYKDFKDLKDLNGSPATLVDGKTYEIQEVDIPSEYELIGIGEEGKQLSTNSYTFTYYEKKNLVILARNRKKDSGYILPETGGTGTDRFTAVGLSLMAASLMCEYVMRRKRRERGN